ncbi:hypothetical protein HMSSN139_13730 [Paenibacillus sp. HMSSN-139]|nr:hypothetical protein HMSSN139_13730 [Paenibacillus sp. HMSSN-139]
MGAAGALPGVHLGAVGGNKAILQFAALYAWRFHAGKGVIAIAEDEMLLIPDPRRSRVILG